MHAHEVETAIYVRTIHTACCACCRGIVERLTWRLHVGDRCRQLPLSAACFERTDPQLRSVVVQLPCTADKTPVKPSGSAKFKQPVWYLKPAETRHSQTSPDHIAQNRCEPFGLDSPTFRLNSKSYSMFPIRPMSVCSLLLALMQDCHAHSTCHAASGRWVAERNLQV